MKKTPGIAAGTMLLLLFSFCSATAQPRSRTFESQNRFLTLNGVTISIDKLSILDSLGPDGKVIYLADFDFPLRNSDDVKSVIRELQAAVQQNRSLSLALSVANFSYEAVEERFYTDASVKLLQVSELDAAERSAAKINVKIRAGSAKIVNDSKVKIQPKLQAGAKSIMASNWQADFGSALPSKMIAKIGPVHLGGQAAGQQGFIIEIGAADMTPWREWMVSQPAKEVNGTIQLLGPDMKEMLIQIELTDVEIISFSVKYGGQQQVIRAMVHLKAKQALIK